MLWHLQFEHEGQNLGHIVVEGEDKDMAWQRAGDVGAKVGGICKAVRVPDNFLDHPTISYMRDKLISEDQLAALGGLPFPEE